MKAIVLMDCLKTRHTIDDYFCIGTVDNNQVSKIKNSLLS